MIIPSRFPFATCLFVYFYSIEAFYHPSSKILSLQHPGSTNRCFYRVAHSINLRNINDSFDLEDDDYKDSKKRRQKFNDYQSYYKDPIEDEFRRMRYTEEPDEYEDYTQSFLSDSERDLEQKDDIYYPIDDDLEVDNNDDDYDDDDDDNDDDDDESRLFERGGGNFWSNPKGGFDNVPKNSRMMNDRRRYSHQRSDTYQKPKTRTRVRTGTSPPSFLKELYDRLFWYGFDPDVTTSAADKTVFGGTKGKFNGLSLLKDVESDATRGMRQRGPKKRRTTNERKRKTGVESDDDNDDEYYYEEYDLYLDDRVIRFDDLFAEKQPDAKNQYSELPLSLPSSKRFNHPNSVEYTGRSRSKIRNKVIMKKQSAQSLTPKQYRRLSVSKKQNPATIFGIMDNLFKIDETEMNARAADYERNIRTGTNNRDLNSNKRRKGFAYKLESMNDPDEVVDEALEGLVPGTVIDVHATNSIQTEPSSSGAAKPEETKADTNRSKWLDRADADERVPPKEVLAWGPTGLIGSGIDARKHAANMAREEIESVKRELDIKRQRVSEAEEDLVLVKAEVSMQKRRLTNNDDEERSDRLRQRLWALNEEVEESARFLRKSREEVKKISEKLAALEKRHWALLSQEDADKILF